MVNSLYSDSDSFLNSLEEQEPHLEEQSHLENNQHTSNETGSSERSATVENDRSPVIRGGRSLLSQNNFSITAEENNPPCPFQYATNTSLRQNGYYLFTVGNGRYLNGIQFYNDCPIDTNTGEQLYPRISPINDQYGPVQPELSQPYLPFVVIKQPGFYQLSVDSRGSIFSIHHWSLSMAMSGQSYMGQDILRNLMATLDRLSGGVTSATRIVAHTTPEYIHDTFYTLLNYRNGHHVNAFIPSPLEHRERHSPTAEESSASRQQREGPARQRVINYANDYYVNAFTLSPAEPEEWLSSTTVQSGHINLRSNSSNDSGHLRRENRGISLWSRDIENELNPHADTHTQDPIHQDTHTQSDVDFYASQVRRRQRRTDSYGSYLPRPLNHSTATTLPPDSAHSHFNRIMNSRSLNNMGRDEATFSGSDSGSRRLPWGNRDGGSGYTPDYNSRLLTESFFPPDKGKLQLGIFRFKLGYV